VKTTTSFLFIRFNSIYLNAQATKYEHYNLGDWVHKIEYVFQYKNHLLGEVKAIANDKPILIAIAKAIKEEIKNSKSLQKEVLQQLINTLLTVIARSITERIYEKSKLPTKDSLEIIHYIQLNINY